jgi:hypothetical protein
VNECATSNGGCDPLTVCMNTPGSFVCGNCPSGYTGTGATACTDINECATNNGGCDPLTTCTNMPGGFTCGTCPMGYTGDSASGCMDINECASNNGGCDQLTTCTNTPGSFTCGACPSGYMGDGSTGCVDVDECATNNGGCDSHTTCTNTPGSFNCGACPSGYTGSGSTGCTLVDNCSPNPCQNGGTCTNGIATYTCACATGYTGTNCQTQQPDVQILVDCSSDAGLLNHYYGTGCFGPIAAGGASYILMGPATSGHTVTLWSGSNCTGCSYVVSTDTNFCSYSFPSGSGCGGLNDQVNSVSIQ